MANRKTNSKERSYVTRSFVIGREQDVALKALAKRNYRTFSHELRLVVDRHLADNGIELKEAA